METYNHRQYSWATVTSLTSHQFSHARCMNNDKLFITGVPVCLDFIRTTIMDVT